MSPRIPAPDAPLGAPDVTRRWALDLGDGPCFPGLTPEEADRAAPALGALDPAARAGALVPVQLPVLLTDGAGPHLVDVAGRLLLAVGAHGDDGDARVAMGPEGPGWEIVGVVRPAPVAPLWRWTARARVAPAARVPALDALLAAAGAAALSAWEARWDAGEDPGTRGAAPWSGGGTD